MPAGPPGSSAATPAARRCCERGLQPLLHSGVILTYSSCLPRPVLPRPQTTDRYTLDGAHLANVRAQALQVPQRAVHGRADPRRHARPARLRHHRQAPPGQRPVRQLGRRPQPRRKVRRRLARAGGVGLVRACTPTQMQSGAARPGVRPGGTLCRSAQEGASPASHTSLVQKHCWQRSGPITCSSP